jgi:chaperone BCS1
MKFGSLVVFEDVDAYFEGRKNNKEKGISFSMLLNCLDGIFSQSGTITIMTTNHPEKLDPALIRHGRIDVKMEITNPNKSEVEKYLQNFYEVESIQNLIYFDGSLSMVQIQDICLLNKNSLSETLNLISESALNEPV